MKDLGSIKIQQLFQETKDLNEKLFGAPASAVQRNNLFNAREALSSKSSNQDYSPVRRPHSRSRSRGQRTSKSRGRGVAGRSESPDQMAQSYQDTELIDWPQQMRNQNNVISGTKQLTGDFRDPDQGRDDDDEEEVYGRGK